MKIAFLLAAGFDGAGLTTLANQISKANVEYDIFVYKGSDKNFFKIPYQQQKGETLIYYDELKEIIEQINSKYDCFINIACPYKDAAEFEKILDNIQITKGCILATRAKNFNIFKRDLISEISIKRYDFIMTFYKQGTKCFEKLKEINNNIIEFDFNFFKWDKTKFKNLQFNERNKVIQYCGRFTSFKGFKHICKNADKLIDKNYLIICQGGDYAYTKNGVLSAPIQTISILCENFPVNKETSKDLYLHTSYSEYEDTIKKFHTDKIHLFTEFERQSKNKRIYKSMFQIFPYLYDKNYTYYKDSLSIGFEYTFLEAVLFGCPIITTKNYGKNFLLKGKPLIEYDCGIIFFDDFSDIFPLIEEYNKSYNKNVEKMQKFFYKNYNNTDRIQKFESIIKRIKQEKGC